MFLLFSTKRSQQLKAIFIAWLVFKNIIPISEYWLTLDTPDMTLLTTEVIYYINLQVPYGTET